jgi:outer membrane protein, heavy metal efflux system
MSCFIGRARAWALSVALFLLPLEALAADLTLTAALRRALSGSPMLATFPASLREADAMSLQARLRPAPVMGVDIENVAGSGDAKGTGNAEYTLALSQTVELGGKRQKRVEAAQWQRHSVAADYDIARVDVLAHTASRFIESARAQAVRDWALRRLIWAQQSAQTVTARISAGAATVAEQQRLELAAVRARMTLERAHVQHRIALADLVLSWGAESADFDDVVARLDLLPELEPEQVWFDRLESAPQIKRYITQERLLAAQQQLVAAQSTPDLTVSLGVRRLEAIDANALVLGASMPLVFGSRQQAGKALAQAQYDRNGAEQQRALLQMRATLRSLYQQLQLARTEAQLLRRDALPKAQSAYREFERGYQAGLFSTLELLTAKDEQLTLEREAIDAEASFHLQQIALQQLTGQVIGEVSP